MAVKKREKPHFESLNELLGAPDVVDGQTEIRIDMIDPFKNHPFKVLDNDDMEDLVESIKRNGVLVPVTVRTNPDDESRYEMISGHRRMHAATLAGLKTIPAIIKEMSDDEATIAMVDSNMQRDEILPSEKAYSIKMKMDAMNRQGARTDLTCGTECHKLSKSDNKKTREEVGESFGLKGRQIQKYLRLTELIPEIMELVDQKRLAIAIGVDVSYFDKNIQKWIYEYCTENGMDGELAGFLKDLGVDVLICGGLGMGAKTRIQEAGIKLFGGVTGKADDAVEAYLNGTLDFDPLAAEHHGPCMH